MSPSFCLFSHHVTCLGIIIVQNSSFFNWEYWTLYKTKGYTELKRIVWFFFSTLKSGQEKFSHNAKKNLRSFSSNVFILISTVLSCRDKMENPSRLTFQTMSTMLNKMWKQDYNDTGFSHLPYILPKNCILVHLKHIIMFQEEKMFFTISITLIWKSFLNIWGMDI